MSNNNSKEFINYLITTSAQGCGVPVSLVSDDSDDWRKLMISLFKLQMPVTRVEMKSNQFQNSDDKTLKFPCPETGAIVKLSYCFDCSKSQRCDIYASMLSEDYD